ncbi:hypothetical protein ACO0QE_002199 [Hanseniaspora vineae]
MIETGIGIDLGSSSIRVSLYNHKDDQLLQTTFRPVPYYTNHNRTKQSWQYAQSTDEILERLNECFEELDISAYNVKALGVAATCSMAVFKADNITPHKLFDTNTVSYPCNVIFWMDSTSSSECESLNKDTLPSYTAKCLGGRGFISEMGIPKLCHLLHGLNEQDSIIAYDLHKFLAWKICAKFDWNYEMLQNTPNANGVGHDGEVSGWSTSIYEHLTELTGKKFCIGPIAPAVPNNHQKIKVNSFIDCYAGWFATAPKLDHSMTMVAGTSTCYLYGSTQSDFHIDGIWGPFTNIFDQQNTIKVYQGGSSLTGQLLSHVLLNHPYCLKNQQHDVGSVIKLLENYVKTYEENDQNGVFQNESKKCFLYGDLEGNRTPFADPDLKGVYIGETMDTSLKSLAIKYITSLEFLVFQTRMIIEKFPEMETLYVVGSQSKNTRLLTLLQISFPKVKIYIAKDIESTEFIGPKGAYLAAKYGSKVIDLDRSNDFQRPQLISSYLETHTREQIFDLMNKKYEITLDIIRSQQKYNAIMS